jgi:hypothetical protein
VVGHDAEPDAEALLELARAQRVAPQRQQDAQPHRVAEAPEEVGQRLEVLRRRYGDIRREQLLRALELALEAEALERVRGAARHRFEQAELEVLELAVELAAGADQQPRDAARAGRQRQVDDAEAEQVGAVLGDGRGALEGLPDQGLGQQRGRVVAGGADAADQLGRATGAHHQHEADLGLVGLAELRRHDGPKLALGAGRVDQRDDLAAP